MKKVLHANGRMKQAGAAVVISDKTNVKLKLTRKEKTHTHSLNTERANERKRQPKEQTYPHCTIGRKMNSKGIRI